MLASFDVFRAVIVEGAPLYASARAHVYGPTVEQLELRIEDASVDCGGDAVPLCFLAERLQVEVLALLETEARARAEALLQDDGEGPF